METEKDSQEVQHKKTLKSVQKTHQKSDSGSNGFPKVLLFEKVVKAPRRFTKSRMEAEKDSQEVQHIKNKKRPEISPEVGWRQNRIPKKFNILKKE